MEETMSVAGATIPAQPAAPVTPVAPAAPETPSPAVADQATIDAASDTPPPPPAPEASAAEKPQEVPATPAASEAPAAPEAAEVPVTEEMVKAAVDLIKRTKRSSAAHFQRKMSLPMTTVEKLLDTLTERGVLGPQEGTEPRKILIEIPAKPAPQPKPQPAHAKPQSPGKFQRKPPMTDYDRMMGWRKHLAEIGHYSDEAFINAMADYAVKNPGYNPRSKWGSCLIVMVNRLANRTLNSLRTFVQSDADYLQRELLRFFSEKPLGDNPTAWNTNFQTNQEQKKAISDFFGINCPFRELRGKPNGVMTAVRDAAWPNQMEEKNGTGGTFAERFHYLAMCVVRFGTSEHAKALFENSFHTEPTQDFLDRVNGVRRPGGFSRPTTPSWIKDGKCVECGSDITKDSSGNDICSNPICPHNIACVATDVAKSFRTGHSKTERVEAPVFDPNSIPAPQKEGGRRQNTWKDKKRKGRGGDEDGFGRGPKHHGKRWRVNDADGDAPSYDGDAGDGASHVVSAGPKDGTFRNNAFASLSLPGTTEQPAAPAKEGEGELPPPPSEVPVPPAAPENPEPEAPAAPEAAPAAEAQ